MATPHPSPAQDRPRRRHRHESPHAAVIEQAVLEILYRVHLGGTRGGGGCAPAPRAAKAPDPPRGGTAAAARPTAERDAWARFQAGLAAGG